MNVMSFKPRACSVALALLVGQAVFVHAQTVLIDFGNDTTYRSLSVINPDTKGHYWNSIQPGLFIENFVDLQNSPTAIDIGWDTPMGFDSYNGPAGPVPTDDDKQDLRDNFLPNTDIDVNALGNLGGALAGPFDYITGTGGADNRVRFQLQQLDPAKKYNLTFFGSHKFSNDTTTVYTVFTDNTYTTSVASVNLDVQGPFNVHNRDRVATISNLSPQTDNILYIQFVGLSGNLGYLNDMQIEAVTVAVPGDYNKNGVVDTADYAIWRDTNGQSGAGLAADGDGNGNVNQADYNFWRARFSNTSGAGSAAGGTSVPEPATVLFAMIAVTLTVNGWPRPHR
jgi:hypothetical protein